MLFRGKKVTRVMSFLSKIVHGVDLVVSNPLSGAVASAFGAGPLFAVVQKGIFAAEAVWGAKGVVKAGPQKKADTVTEYENWMAPLQMFMAQSGKTISYDKDALADLIDAQVKAVNAADKLYKSWKPVDLPKV